MSSQHHADGPWQIANRSNASTRSFTGYSYLAIIALAWSTSGDWIASGDDSGHILVRKVQMPAAASGKITADCPSPDESMQMGVETDRNTDYEIDLTYEVAD
jgi:hypothetical protein